MPLGPPAPPAARCCLSPSALLPFSPSRTFLIAPRTRSSHTHPAIVSPSFDPPRPLSARTTRPHTQLLPVAPVHIGLGPSGGTYIYLRLISLLVGRRGDPPGCRWEDGVSAACLTVRARHRGRPRVSSHLSPFRTRLLPPPHVLTPVAPARPPAARATFPGHAVSRRRRQLHSDLRAFCAPRPATSPTSAPLPSPPFPGRL